MVPDFSEEEKKLLLYKYKQLLKVCKPFTEHKDKLLIRKAFNLATEAHKGMRRRSGEPYIFHPLEVATISAGEIGLGTTSIICALLHDVVEDTDYSLDDIKGLFGEKVARIIDGLTKISGIIDHTGASPSIQAENFRKILLTLSDDVRVILIKLADRLHNMRTLDSMPPDKKLKIASETSFLYAPLAHRLGLYAIKSEFEDLVLKYTEPEIYHSIAQQLIDTQEERNIFIKSFITPLENRLLAEGVQCEIIGRTKSINSIWTKMKRKSIPFGEVYDIFAIRIIIDSIQGGEKLDCWKAYAVVTETYWPNPDRLRDWISVPKANGYEALHTTVMSHEGKWVEVQIRSRRMDEIAEKGYAAHWKYKEDIRASEGALDDWLSKIRELLQRPESNALDFLDDFKLTLFSDEIYVFTPQGDMKNLPKGSTALDFAYNIHTALGNKCIGAKVNHKLVSLSHVLKSGDQVEVLTSDKQSPKEEWESFVVTARAKSQIKTAVKEEKKKLVERGTEVIMRMYAQVKAAPEADSQIQFAKFIGLESLSDLYLQAAKGQIEVKALKAFLSSNERSRWINYIRSPFVRKHNAKDDKEVGLGNIQDLNKIRSIDLNTDSTIKYQNAECCNPIPGDDAVGFIKSESELEIHRVNCVRAIQLMSRFGDRIITVKWNSTGNVSFLTGIQIFGMDKIGVVRDISKIISEELTLNIRSFNLESTNNMFEGKIMLYVNDTQRLKQLMKKIKTIDGVEKVVRIS